MFDYQTVQQVYAQMSQIQQELVILIRNSEGLRGEHVSWHTLPPAYQAAVHLSLLFAVQERMQTQPDGTMRRMQVVVLTPLGQAVLDQCFPPLDLHHRH